MTPGRGLEKMVEAARVAAADTRETERRDIPPVRKFEITLSALWVGFGALFVVAAVLWVYWRVLT